MQSGNLILAPLLSAPFKSDGLFSPPHAPLVVPLAGVVLVVLLASSATPQQTMRSLLAVRLVRVFILLASNLLTSTASDCRGSVESAGTCADTTWSLYQGVNGNDFCCEVGKIGIVDYSSSVAGSCVDSGSAASATTAVLVSLGLCASIARNLTTIFRNL